MSTKAEDAFKTISETSALLDVPPHVLRFWESKFRSLRPLKRSGGRRYYRSDDLAVLRRIKKLLYIDGFTIKGAQKLMRSKSSVDELGLNPSTGETNAQTLTLALTILDDVKTRIAVLKQKLAT